MQTILEIVAKDIQENGCYFESGQWKSYPEAKGNKILSEEIARFIDERCMIPLYNGCGINLVKAMIE